MSLPPNQQSLHPTLAAVTARIVERSTASRTEYVRRIEAAMMPHLFASDRPPEVLPAGLGDLGGAVGATLLV